jgi:hypothetical protein
MERFKKIVEAGGVGLIKVRDLIFIMFTVARMDIRKRHVGSHGRRSKKSGNKRKKKVRS